MDDRAYWSLTSLRIFSMVEQSSFDNSADSIAARPREIELSRYSAACRIVSAAITYCFPLGTIDLMS